MYVPPPGPSRPPNVHPFPPPGPSRPPNVNSFPPPEPLNVNPPRLSQPPNVNPFYVKFIAGNIRICQGCKGSLKTSDNRIPTPPFDIAAARSENRPFRDASGNLITPKCITTTVALSAFKQLSLTLSCLLSFLLMLGQS